MSNTDPSPKGPTSNKRPLLIIGALALIVLFFLLIPRVLSSSSAQESEPAEEPAAVAPGNGGGDSSGDAQTSASGSASASQEPTLSGDGRDQAPELADWETTAEDFAEQWANPEGGKDAWLERLRPLTNDEAYEGLENTSENAIPDLEYNRVEVHLEQGNQIVADGFYGDEGAVLRMGLVPEGSDWKVAYVTEAD